MAKRLDRESLTATFSPKNSFELTAVAPGSPKKAIWECQAGHEWETAVRKVVQQGQRCPYCQNKKVLKGFNDLESKRPDLLAFYDYSQNPRPDEIQETHNKPVWWHCPIGHSWEEKPFTLTKRTENYCPECRDTKDSIAVRSKNLLPWLANLEDKNLSASSRSPINLVCPNGHHFEESPGLLKNSPRCYYCEGTKVLAGFNDLATLYPKLALEWNDSTPIETVSRQSSLRADWKCQECGYCWEAFVYNRTSGYGDCFKCSLKTGSKPQRELGNFIESLGFNPSYNKKGLLEGNLEVDIYIPEKKVAIEFNGLYWHSTDKHQDINRHFEKWKSCQAAGIKLIVVWDDEWRENRAVVEKLLAHKLGVSSLETVFARKTSASKLATAEIKAFLNFNHIQGATAGRGYGLKDETGRVVAAMLVRKSSSLKGHLEIVRYATACNVPGGFTKLLAHVKENESPSGFVTFSDNSLSEGELYSNSGFICDKELAPDYSYIVRGKREHKFNYRLKRFEKDPRLKFIKGLSERELATVNGLKRAYDYGKKRWILQFTDIESDA